MQSRTQTPAALAERLRAIGISQSYASQIVNGRRAPSLALALRIHREIGVKLGPIADASPAEIRTLKRLTSESSQAA